MGLFQALSALFIPMSAMDVDPTLSNNSDDLLATQKAVKTYVGNPTNFLKVYKGGTLRTAPKFYYSSGVVSGGNVTFYLTTDGTASGSAIFASVDKESFSWWIDDNASQYQLGSYALAGDKKSITLTVNKLGTVLIGIIQFVAAANGATVNLAVWGE